jgi:hypothetical protein
VRIDTAVTTRFVVIALILASLSLRCGYFAGHGPELGGDTGDYLRLANNLSTNGIYGYESPLSFTVSMSSDTPTIRRPPVYPFFLALLGGWSEPSPVVVVVFQIILDSVIASFIFLALRAVAALWLSLIGALLYALNPEAVITSIKVMSESLFTFLLFSSVTLIALGLARDKLVATAMGAVLLGIAILCRSVALPLPLLFAISLCFIHSLKRRKLHATLIICLASLVVIPWTIRCSRLADSLVLVQGASAIQFYVASRSDLDQKRHAELYDKVFGSTTTDPYGRKVREATNSAEIAQSDQLGYRLALENIKADPKRYLSSRARSFPHLFLTSFDTFTGVDTSFGYLWRNPDFTRLSIKISLLMLFSAIPFFLALLGVLECRKHPVIMLCSIVWIYNWLVHIPLWIEYRFWHPVVPCLFVCSAVGIGKLLSSRRFLFTKW